MGEFIGHLHPALVHMPIGFIILSVLSDWYYRKRTYTGTDKLSTFMWGISWLSCVAALSTGTVLLMSGYFEGKHMFFHLLSGWGIMIVTTLIFITQWKQISFFKSQNKLLKGLVLILLLISGHNGGILTHGENYLPIPLISEGDDEELGLEALDSISVYGHILEPVFAEKCVRCHEVGDARGKLDMTSVEGLTDDTFGDPGISGGKLNDSEVFKRVTLAPNHRKYMPPSGPIMTYGEVKVLEWWILSGASFTDNLRAMEVDPEMKSFFLNEYGIDLRQKTFYEKVLVEAVDPAVIQDIKNHEFNISRLASTSNFLDVSRVGHASHITDAQLASLMQAKEQITWIDFSSTDVNDYAVETLVQLPHLTKLRLQNTKITDKSLQMIAENLKHLSVLNIYGTQITDNGLNELAKMTSLQKLFLWQTDTSSEGINKLRAALPQTNVVTGH